MHVPNLYAILHIENLNFTLAKNYFKKVSYKNCNKLVFS